MLCICPRICNSLSNRAHRYFINKSTHDAEVILDLILASLVNEMEILPLLYNTQAVNKRKEVVSKICNLDPILIPVAVVFVDVNIDEKLFLT